MGMAYIRQSWLLLICAFAPQVVAVESSLQQLSKQLQQLHQDSSETLRWMLPSEDEVFNAEQAGIDPPNCGPPIAAYVSPPIQLLVRCHARQYVGFLPVTLDSLTAWTYEDNAWAVGQMLYLKIVDYSAEALGRQRHRALSATHWHLDIEDYARLVAQLSSDEQIKLSKFWRQLPDLPNSIHRQLDEWTNVAWPKGLIGFRRGGGLLLQTGSLVGVTELQQKFAGQDSLPEVIQGVFRPTTHVYGYGQTRTPKHAPMYLLHSFSYERKQYAIGLTALPADDGSDEWQILGRDGDYAIVLATLNRDL